jgi:hypothetical protein
MTRTRVRLVGGAVVVVLVAALFVNPLHVGTPRERPDPRGPADVKIVTVDPDSGAELWPYTSKRRRFDTLTLPINVVVRGNAWRVRSLLVTGTDAAWNGTSGEWQGVGDEMGHDSSSDRDWYESHGATRYTYVHAPSSERGGWIDETYQLHDGDYFGTRYHLRAYAGGDGDSSWTAIQAHYEHWDWFRLRHTVGSTAMGRQYVEREFFARPAVADVSRERFANGGISDADGWVSVASLTDPRSVLPHQSPARAVVASVSLLVGGLSLTGLRARLRESTGGADRRLVALTVVAVALLPGVRWAALAVERALPGLSPKPIAAVGYLLVALGLPVCAFAVGRATSATTGVLVAVGGVAVGLLVDYTLVGVTVLPLSVVIHRTALLAALGVVAASGSPNARARFGRVARVVGVVALWGGVLAWPLVDVL